MNAVQLSPAALEICAANYGKVGSTCHRCPIQAACHSSPTWGWDGLNAHTTRVNEAAKAKETA